MECVVFANVWNRFRVTPLKRLAGLGNGCWAGRVCAAWVPAGLGLLGSNVLMVEINSPLDGCLRNRLPFFKVFALFMCSFKR